MASFPSIRIEGGLLGPELLDQVIAADVPGQKPADFGLEPKRNLTDEIAAAFADSKAQWGIFKNRLARLPEDDLATTVTRDTFVIPFLGLLGYELTFNARAHEVDGQSFAVSHAVGLSRQEGRKEKGEGEQRHSLPSPLSPLPSSPAEGPPIHIVGARQELGRVPPSGRPRLAPHSLVQEYLNRTEHVWGIVTNGLTLRLLRDSTLVRRQAYIEFDLQAIFEEQRFHDFAALYRLLHRSRLPRGLADANECLLEKYYAQTIEQGGRVREHLRDGVKLALESFGNGFLSHPSTANGDLLRALAENRITPHGYYQQLLRLIYRLLFLMVSEERNLLVSRRPESVAAAEIYRRHYSVTRLRRLVEQSAAYNEHDDIWQSLCLLFHLLRDDKPSQPLGSKPLASLLGLPLLNGKLFDSQDLDGLSLRNRDFLTALWHLSNYRDERTNATRHVNYSALDVEELGSVYESLLEFHPHLDLNARPPSFALIEEGGERRSTGSHYTPPELVSPLIKHALEPVLAERLRNASTREQKERAILSLKVCDLACGSGHFLLAAARRLGKELARVRTGEDEPAPERVREAVRDAITHCIYGVDKNPLAVELCRVALWLEGHAEDKPLTFLDHRIRCGDSLVGVFDLKALEAGIPDEAFKPVAGEDKDAARAAKTRNARERRESLFRYAFGQQLQRFATELERIDALPEDTIEQVRTKADAYRRLEHAPDFQKLELACNVWTAAFFQPFVVPASAGSEASNAPALPDRLKAGLQTPVTTEALRTALSTGSLPDKRLAGWIQTTAQERAFFHWPLVFPEVFASGGFDVFLGNPPFLGGLKISQEFGDHYRKFLETAFDEFTDRPDICAAFFRRAFDAVVEPHRIGLIATNSIGQGDTRIAGLASILRKGGSIAFASRFVKWPGQANVEVNLLALVKGAATAKPILDGKEVEFISSRLDSEPEAEPAKLSQSDGKTFEGAVLHGVGFALEPHEAERLIAADQRNAECLRPFLGGEDITTHPQQQPARQVICFFDWPLERAHKYAALMRIVLDRVKPLRDTVKTKRARERWWLFEHYPHGLRHATQRMQRMLVRAQTGEMHALAFVPTSLIPAQTVIVFAFDDYFHFALLQSNVHEAWVRRNASTMRTDIRYTPTDCFETFAFPQSPSAAARVEAEQLGETYHEHRRQTMLARQLGLTKTYNLFHNPQCADADIARLRELHAAMDLAVLACYGWTDLDPGHGFHQNERGQTRYTISPTARRDLLRRLLALNLEIAKRESGVL
jgi:hypothetical protein